MHIKYIHPFKIFISKTVHSSAACSSVARQVYSSHRTKVGDRLPCHDPSGIPEHHRSCDLRRKPGTLQTQQHGSKGAILKVA